MGSSVLYLQTTAGGQFHKLYQILQNSYSRNTSWPCSSPVSKIRSTWLKGKEKPHSLKAYISSNQKSVLPKTCVKVDKPINSFGLSHQHHWGKNWTQKYNTNTICLSKTLQKNLQNRQSSKWFDPYQEKVTKFLKLFSLLTPKISK